MPLDRQKDQNHKLETIDTDVVIIGAGAAGCQAALSLAPRETVLISPAAPGGDSASLWAQGGIAAAVDTADSPQLHSRDTLKAAAGTANPAMVKMLTDQAPDIINSLDLMGVQFDRDTHGQYRLGREACHSARRILKARTGDGFGRELMRALILSVAQAPQIKAAFPYTAETLAQDATGRVCGVYTRHAISGEIILYRANAVILASGGIGGLYSLTTNPPGSVGRGVALAARAGAVLSDLEFVQFHPTALDIGIDPAPLATEALRGEGARLVNDQGVYFMDTDHPMAELAPRDIVSRSIFRQNQMGFQTFLDCRQIDTGSFPALRTACAKVGLDPDYDLIPVRPAAHYHMGGIDTDIQGRTSLPGLWAAGETAATGLHGANRLASNSLMEALVMGRRVAADIRSTPRPAKQEIITPPPAGVRMTDTAHAVYRRHIREIMQDGVGVMRSRTGLVDALTLLAELARMTAGQDEALADMVLLAELITRAALARTESRGGHYRTDYPQADNSWKRRSFTALSPEDVQTHTPLIKGAPAMKEAAE